MRSRSEVSSLAEVLKRLCEVNLLTRTNGKYHANHPA